MAYFVTGATGFIGRYLVENLLKRGRPIYVLVRKGSEKKLAAMRERWGADDKQVIGVAGDLAKPGLGVSAADVKKLKGKIDHFFHLAAIYDIAASAEAQQVANVEGTKHAVRFAEHDPGRLLPPRELDRRGGSLRRHVPRGHVRGGRRPRPSVLQDQARFRGRRAPRVQAAVPHLPPGIRRRPFEDRRDRQDRRAVLLLQDAAEDARTAAAVDADDRHRGRADQHRAGGLRRRRARLPRAQEGARRQVLPPDRSRAATGSARCSTSSPTPATRRR